MIIKSINKRLLVSPKVYAIGINKALTKDDVRTQSVNPYLQGNKKLIQKHPSLGSAKSRYRTNKATIGKIYY